MLFAKPSASMRGIDENRQFNRVLEKARSDMDTFSSLVQEAHHQMEMVLHSGLKFLGALAGLLFGVLGSCGGCGGF